MMVGITPKLRRERIKQPLLDTLDSRFTHLLHLNYIAVIIWTHVRITIITIYRKQSLARESFYGYRQINQQCMGAGHNDKGHVHSVETC